MSTRKPDPRSAAAAFSLKSGCWPTSKMHRVGSSRDTDLMVSRRARHHYRQLSQIMRSAAKRAHRSVLGGLHIGRFVDRQRYRANNAWVVVSGIDDQRRHQRVPFDGSVRVDGVAAQGVDVSMGGLRVSSVHPAPELGTTVLVEFHLPQGGPIATHAEVARVEDGVFVLRFVRLGPHTMVTLAKYASSDAA